MDNQELRLEDLLSCFTGAGLQGLTETEAQAWMSDTIPRNRFIPVATVRGDIALLVGEGKLIAAGTSRKGLDVFVNKNFQPSQSALDLK